jgi:hypothetical protein
MSESDALTNMKIEKGGLFVSIKEGEPQTLRILTLDPLVSRDQWGNTRYSFVVWNWTTNKAQVLSKGLSVVKPLQALHLDEDFEPLNKLDVKISASGQGMETRYTITPLQKARDLSNDMIKEAASIKLEDVIRGGIRLSAVNEGEDVPGAEGDDENHEPRSLGNEYRERQATKQDVVIEDIGDEPINLDDIPF